MKVMGIMIQPLPMSSVTQPFTRSPQTPPLRIVIVEDDPVMQVGLEQLLANYPEYEVVDQASSGYEGLEMVAQLQPDLVIMDIGLPQLDGIAATRQIKQTYPDMRVVILTSHTAETEMLAALSSGADAYCIKNANGHQLLVAIASAKDGAIYLDPCIARNVVEHLQPGPDPSQISQLTDRELEVLRLIVDGKTNPEIANSLYLSTSTVKAHVRNIMNKLSVDDRVQAAVIALRNGLVR
jgi:DNA-binding NarL/FixJ family response regulator